MATKDAQVAFFYPGADFPAVSVTGGKCALQCDHCRGHYLQGMRPVSTPSELATFARGLKAKNGEGFLLSGGCDQDGRIPLLPYIDAVRLIRSDLGLRVNLHTGLLDRGQAKDLVNSEADCYSLDIVQDEGVIRERLHLAGGPRLYADTLEALFEAGAKKVVPHVCIGLSDEIEGELRSIDLVSHHPIGALVLLGFLPVRGTPLFENGPPDAQRFMTVLRYALQKVECPVMIGCMRARGDWQLEIECIKAGASGMASPSRHTREWARAAGYEILEKKECCALHL
jgi:lipoyl synthase